MNVVAQRRLRAGACAAPVGTGRRVSCFTSLEHDARAHVRHAGQAEQRVVLELLVGLDVGDQHVEDVVGRAGGADAAHDLRAGGHRALEAAQQRLAVLAQVQLHHHRQLQAWRSRSTSAV